MSIDPDVARPLLAGFIAGVAVAFALTALLLWTLVHSPAWRHWLVRVTVPMGPLGVVVANALLLACSMAGLLLGVLYLAVEETWPGGAPGTSNVAFSAIVATLFLLAPLAAWFVRGATSRVEWAATAVLVAAFAWLLPFLAGIK